jgi:two-component system, cell cycle response regulator
MRLALVEPSRTVWRIVTAMVRPLGHEVCAFTDAPEALAFLRLEKSVRALITSAELATTSGLQLVHDARTLAGAWRPLYILLMSSSDEQSRLVQALDNGADDFISKPPAPEELRARLRAADRITSMQAEMITLATTDSLTGLLTRRAFVEAAESMLREAGSRHPVSVAIFDLDRFKTINDTYGHGTGDLVLQKVAQEFKSIKVPAGRLGGEELVILVERRLDDAIEIAEGVRAAVSGLAIRAGEKIVKITCSAGVAEWEPGDTIDSVLRRADVALYEAKRSGRNRVVAAHTFVMDDAHEQWRGVSRLRLRSQYVTTPVLCK